MNEQKRRRVSLISDVISPDYQYVYYSFLRKYIKNRRVLDVGCWSGIFASFATLHAKKVIGIDHSKEAIKLAKKQAPKAFFKVGSVENLPFRSRSFDVVVFFMVLEHIPKGMELKALLEIYRVLKPNGYLILDTPNSHFLSILLDPGFFLLGHRHYSKKQLRRMFQQSGFLIKNIYTRGGILHQVMALPELMAKHIFHIALTYPKWLQDKIYDDYERKGFSS